MTYLDLVLLSTGIASAVLFCLLFSKRFSWNWTRYYGMDAETAKRTVPIWLPLVTLLSIAAVVFSIHAAAVVHGVIH